MIRSQWTDDQFLDGLRRQGDPAADQAVAKLIADRGERAVGYIFQVLRANDEPIPADAPPAFLDFMEATKELPPGVDATRLERGGAVFLQHALPAVIVFLASSLPRGYAAPCLCEILSISRDLQRHPFDRLMGVVQMLVNISNADAFKPRGKAIVTAQKMRLLHAGIRTMVPRFRPGYQERFGVPVNHEDMLATIMGFSYLLIDGLQRLNLGLTDAQTEDLYYLWRIFAQLMGIHPEGRPEDDSLIPADIAEAAAFYASYVRRNETGAEQNPYGVLLTQDNTKMMEALLPATLRHLGLSAAPMLCMTELMTPEELARVGVQPMTDHHIIRGALNKTLAGLQGVMGHLPFSARLAGVLLQGMVKVDRGSEVTFTVPFELSVLHGSALQ